MKSSQTKQNTKVLSRQVNSQKKTGKYINKAKKETVEWIKAFLYAAVAVIIIRLFVFETMMVPTGSMIPTIKINDRLFVERITYQAREPEYGEIVVFWTPFIDLDAQKMLGVFDKFMDLFSPAKFKGHVKYVKRLIGKPGDILEMAPNFGGTGYKILVNGKTPENLKNINYIKDGIFDDVEFFKKLAYPDQYPVISSKFTKAFFVHYNQSLDYKNTYEELYSDLEVKDYAWKDSESGRIRLKVPEGFYFFMGDNSPESFDGRMFGFVPKENVVGGPLLRIWPLDRFGPVNR